MKTELYISIFIIVLLLYPSSLFASKHKVKSKKKTKILMMRARTVEGALDRPAIIIIPRARLFGEGIFRKSYHKDIVQDIYLGTFAIPKESGIRNQESE